MKLSQITPKNIKAFIEGYTKLIYDEVVGLPYHLQEQILYRQSKCKSCIDVGHETEGPGHCERCGCSIPGKWYVTKSCNNGDKFPDLMDDLAWEQFKKDNDIEL